MCMEGLQYSSTSFYRVATKMKAVLFDLDETVLDRRGSLMDFARWQARGMLKSESIDERAFIQRFVELDDNGALWKDKVYEQLISEFSITSWSVGELLTSYELCYCGFCKPKPLVVDAIEKMVAMGLKCAIVSNGKSPFQERNFAGLGISHLFDEVVISDAVGVKKPDTKIFQLTCQKLDIEPHEAVFVGDNPIADIKGANQSGIYSVFIPGFFGQTCDHADKVCSDYTDLPAIIESLTYHSPKP